MVCICYVNDCLFFAREESNIVAMIEDLHKDFTLDIKEEVIQFLKIEHTHTPEGKLKLVQTTLIEKTLAFCGLSDCNTKVTPANQIPLGSDPLGPEQVETWNFAYEVGMLLYLAQNKTRHSLCCPSICQVHTLSQEDL